MTTSRSDPDYYPQIKINGDRYLIADDLGDSCRHCAFYDRFGLQMSATSHCMQMELSPDKGRELFERHDCEAAATVFLDPKALEKYGAIAVTRRMEE